MRLSFLSALLVTGVSLTIQPSAHAAPPPTCDGRPATIVGTSDADRLTGTSGTDVIVARGGDDVVHSRGGDDVICGGEGADVLRGGAGDDVLHGQLDRLVTDRGGTYLVPDELSGGLGDDLLDVGADRRSRVDWGTFGVLDFQDAAQAVTVDLAAGTVTGQGSDTIRDVTPAPCPDCSAVDVRGSRHGDVLLGSDATDDLTGMQGDDRIEGRGGDDVLRAESDSTPIDQEADDDTVSGGAGADLLMSDLGRDVLHGDDGDDTVWSLDGGPSEVYGDAGDDRLAAWFSRAPGFVLDGGEGFDEGQLLGPDRVGAGGRPEAAAVHLDDGSVTSDDLRIGTVTAVEDLLVAGGVRWTVYGTDQADIVRGAGASPFRVWTYGGDDEVWGTTGADRIDTGDGQDTVRAGRGRDTCLNAEDVRGCEVTA